MMRLPQLWLPVNPVARSYLFITAGLHIGIAMNAVLKGDWKKAAFFIVFWFFLALLVQLMTRWFRATR